MQAHRTSSGFTLLELMIVTAILAILASIAVPNFASSRSSANETAAVQTLRSLASAQIAFKSQQVVDANGNGVAEFATILELTGDNAVRGGTERLSPGLLPRSFSGVDAAGRLSQRGYHFALYLPDAAGTGLGETAANLGNIAPSLAESFWTCLAWPALHGVSGNTTFFVNQQGEILKAPQATYSGISSVPPAGAALLGVAPTIIVSQSLASGQVGADGNRWLPVH